MQRRGLHGGFRHRVLLCLSRVLFVFFCSYFSPQAVKSESRLPELGSALFPGDCRPLLALERSVGYLSDPAKSFETPLHVI